MDAAATNTQRSQEPRLVAAQWLVLVGPPFIWLLQFEARYALAGTTRGSPGHVAMTICGLTALVLIALLGLVARAHWRHAATSPLDRMAGVTERVRFVGLVGLLNSGFFFLAAAAQLLAQFFIEPGKS